MEKENAIYLKTAAHAVFKQLADDPTGPGVPVDPDVADFLGATTEDAVTLVDLMDDALLSIDEAGRVYVGDE